MKAAIDGFGQIGHLVSGEKLTFAMLPPEVRPFLLGNAAEWRALTLSKDAFPALPVEAVRRIKAPTLMLSGQRTLELHKVIDGQLERLLPRNERVIIPDATHEMWSEYPEQCRSAALAFVAKH